jgi:hypothetical protein
LELASYLGQRLGHLDEPIDLRHRKDQHNTPIQRKYTLPCPSLLPYQGQVAHNRSWTVEFMQLRLPFARQLRLPLLLRPLVFFCPCPCPCLFGLSLDLRAALGLGAGDGDGGICLFSFFCLLLPLVAVYDVLVRETETVP